MLDPVTATRYIRALGNGRTDPALAECEREDGTPVEVVVKCSDGCFEKEKNLCFEAVASMLAADLGIAVPEPFIVYLDPHFVAALPECTVKARWRRSCTLAFGSRHLTEGFIAWPTGRVVPQDLCTKAAEIFVFDAIVINSDRKPGNPNCLYTGTEFAVFDHELAFTKELFWKPPWESGGIDGLNNAENHIFSKPYLASCPQNLDRFVQSWRSIVPARFVQYMNALPNEWVENVDVSDWMVRHLMDVQANIEAIVDHALRGLR